MTDKEFKKKFKISGKSRAYIKTLKMLFKNNGFRENELGNVLLYRSEGHWMFRTGNALYKIARRQATAS